MVNSIVITPRTKANPLHQFDYEARLDCSDESGLVVGYGRSEEECHQRFEFHLKPAD